MERGQQPIRYAKTVTLHVTLQTDADSRGLIFPPYLEVTYAEAFAEDYDANAKAEVGRYHCTVCGYVCVCVGRELCFRLIFNVSKSQRFYVCDCGLGGTCYVLAPMTIAWYFLDAVSYTPQAKDRNESVRSIS